MTTMPTEQTAPTTIGSTVEERRLAPIGARIRPTDGARIRPTDIGSRILTKVGPDLWHSEHGSDRSNDHGGWYPTAPDSTYTVLDWPVLREGDALHYGFEREVLPVGSQIVLRGGQRTLSATFTKVGPNLWEERDVDGNVVATRTNHDEDTWLGEGEQTDYGYLVQRVGPETAEPIVLDVPSTMTDLPLDSTFWWTTTPEIVWRVVEGGAMMSGSDVPVMLSTFEGPFRDGALTFGDGVEQAVSSPVTELPVGHVITSDEEFDSLPVGTTINWRDLHNRTKNPDGRWYLAADRADGTSSHDLTNDQWIIASLPALTAVEPDRDESVITITAHEAALIVAREQAVAERNEAFLSELRSAWDGYSFTESEIDEVLCRLGLPDLVMQEEVTVDVVITGHTDLDDSDVRGLFEGDYTADVTDSAQVCWTIEESFYFEVSTGSCACDQMERSVVRDRLLENNVTFAEFDYSASCVNCR